MLNTTLHGNQHCCFSVDETILNLDEAKKGNRKKHLRKCLGFRILEILVSQEIKMVSSVNQEISSMHKHFVLMYDPSTKGKKANT